MLRRYFYRGRHRGHYGLRPQITSRGGMILHIPQRGFLRSKTLIAPPGAALLPYLSTSHAREGN